MSQLILTADEVTGLFESLGAVPWRGQLIADSRYACPTRAWVEGEFTRGLFKFTAAISAVTYAIDEWDCDNFTACAALFGHLCHKDTAIKSSGTALAVGEFWFTTRNGHPHAINVLIVNNGGKPLINFYEPQSLKIVNLNQKEIESCSGLRF